MSVHRIDGEHIPHVPAQPSHVEAPHAPAAPRAAETHVKHTPPPIADGMELVSHAELVRAKSEQKRAEMAAKGLVGQHLQPGQQVSAEVSNAHGIEASVSVKLGRTQPEPGLKNYATLEVSGSVSLSAELSHEGKKLPLSVGGSLAKGVKLTYEAKVTADQAKNIQQGKLQVPNPFDPAKMPEGTATVLKAEHFTNTALEGAYKHVAAELGYTSARGLAFGVEKVSPTQVKVTAGPYNAVENEAFVGVKGGELAVGLSLQRGLEDSKSRTVTLDISKPEGRDAYYRLLATGQFPKENAAHGITQSGTTQAVKVTGNASAVAQLGPVASSFNLGGNEGELKKTTFGNGTSELEATVRYQNGKAVILNRSFDKTGKENESQTTAKLLVGHNSGHTAAIFFAAFAKDWDPKKFDEITKGPPRDIQIQINNAQAHQIADLARQYIVKYNGSRGFDGAPESVMKKLARATTAEEMAKVFAKQDATAVAQELITLRRTFHEQKPLAGWLTMQKSP